MKDYLEQIEAEKARIRAKGDPCCIINRSATAYELIQASMAFSSLAKWMMAYPKTRFDWQVENYANNGWPHDFRKEDFNPSRDPHEMLIQSAAWLGLAMDKLKEEAAAAAQTTT